MLDVVRLHAETFGKLHRQTRGKMRFRQVLFFARRIAIGRIDRSDAKRLVGQNVEGAIDAIFLRQVTLVRLSGVALRDDFEFLLSL